MSNNSLADNKMPEKNVALVLSSGGSKGLAHIGVINELERQGYTITSVSGSSIGALIGGLHAMDKLPAYTDWVKTLDKKKIWGLMDFTFSKNGLLKGERVFNTMKTFIPDQLIENMRIPFAAVATDIINEREVVFSSGSYYAAIRASIAIPTAFKPVRYNDTLLVDGGVLSPVPVEFVKRHPDDLLVVVNLYGSQKEKAVEKEIQVKSQNFVYKKYNDYVNNISSLIASGDKNSLGYFSVLNASAQAMVHKLSQMAIDKHQPDITIQIPSNAAGTFGFDQAEALIGLGESLAKKEMDAFLKRHP